MANKRIVTELRADSAQLRAEFGKAQKKVRDFTGGLKAGKAQLIGFAAGFIGVRSGIELFSQLVDSASDLNETLSKTAAIFGNDNTISDWATRQADALGLSTKDALDYASRFGGALKEIGGKTESEAERISQQLVGLSSDMASFFNSDQGSVRDALAAALTGEFEQLKKYNVVINETILKEKALAMGLSDGKGVLNARQKQLAALELIYDKTGDAQGDFAKTADGVANQQRILRAQLENTRAELGQKLLPVQLQFIKIARDGIEVVGEMTPALKIFAEGVAGLTRFLVEHRQAVALVLGGWLSYHSVIKGFQFANVITGLVQTRLALNATTASAGGLVTQLKQARLSLLGLIAMAPAVAKIGYDLGKAFGGNAIADNFVGNGPRNEITDEEIRKGIEMARIRDEQARQIEAISRARETEIKNENYWQSVAKESNRLRAEQAKRIAETRAELVKEIRNLAAGVRENEIATRSAVDQLKAYEEQLDRLAEKTRRYSESNGLDSPGSPTSEQVVDMAREAAARGRLEVAKELLLVAEKMQEKKAKILAIEKEIKSTEESKAREIEDAAKEVADKQSRQKEALREQAQELTILKLRKAGREEEAEALEKEIELRNRAKEIAEQTGLSEANALKLARAKQDLTDKANGRPQGLDNRFDEEGNRKMSRDGERKKIVLIRRDENGNRIDSAASSRLAEQRRAAAAKSNPLVGRTDRLIDLTERQLKVLENLQTSS